ncbi:MAG: EVE domain-containing protein [Myxococcota bacterium]
MAAKIRYWLLKSEPNVYSIDDLQRDGRAEWEGVRNYQARNFLRDEMHEGDLVLFYHSNAKPPGVAGVARVCREGYPDATQFDPRSGYHDPKSKREAPRWYRVDVEFVEKFDAMVPLDALKRDPALEGMKVIQKGQRLSVQPVDAKHFRRVLKMAGATTRI